MPPQTRTKIVATIGPASDSAEKLVDLVEAGVDVFRLNFSHGTHEYHRNLFKLIKEVGGDRVATLIDLSGPKFRIGDVEEPFELTKGERLILTSREVVCGREERCVTINHKLLPQEVSPGNTLYINDGLVGLRVDKVVDNTDIYTTCFAGGPISSRKGINAPDVNLSISFPTKKDIEDVRFAMKIGPPDFFAASFVRKPTDVDKLRVLFKEFGCKVPVIAKIEHGDALKQIDAIVEAFDGIMVARGDLGIEVPTEDVPIIQKDLIRRCNVAGKPVITATQMLESMTNNRRPTRAEASDVSNAVVDGTDAVMLSAETATGRYPTDTVGYMDRIASRAEELVYSRSETYAQDIYKQCKENIAEVLGFNTYYAAKKLKPRAILAITRSGGTARLVAKYRPKTPIIACTAIPETARQLQLMWGVIPLIIPVATSIEDLIYHSIGQTYEEGYVGTDDLVIVIAGTLMGLPARTNLIQVFKVGEVLALEAHFGPLII